MFRMQWPASLVFTACPAMLLIGCAGCGGGSSTTPQNNNVSAAQAQAISHQFVQTVTQALQSAIPLNSSAGAEARPSLSAAINNIRADQLAGCTPTATGEDCNFPLSFTGPCPNGGDIAVSGNIDGTLDNSGGGSLATQVTLTPMDCAVSNLTFNGDPNVSIAGQIAFTSTAPVFPVSLTEAGGISYGPNPSGSCKINVTYTINSATSCSVSGTFCGQSVTGSC